MPKNLPFVFAHSKISSNIFFIRVLCGNFIVSRPRKTNNSPAVQFPFLKQLVLAAAASAADAWCVVRPEVCENEVFFHLRVQTFPFPYFFLKKVFSLYATNTFCRKSSAARSARGWTSSTGGRATSARRYLKLRIPQIFLCENELCPDTNLSI